MKEMLLNAQKGSAQEKEQAVIRVKSLPRDDKNLFIMREIDEDRYAAGRLVYPLYMEYETLVNKKEGYMDLMEQLLTLNNCLEDDYSIKNACEYVAMLMDTILVMAPEIYEHYRRLVDIFKSRVKEILSKEQISSEKLPNSDQEYFALLGQAMVKACKKDLMLAEKYEELGVRLMANQERTDYDN